MFFFAATLYSTFLTLIHSFQKPTPISVITQRLYSPCWLLNASLLGPTFLAEYNKVRTLISGSSTLLKMNLNFVVVVRGVLYTTRVKTRTIA
jgi:hypothetical protein